MHRMHPRRALAILGAFIAIAAVLAASARAAPVKVLIHCTPDAWQAQVDPIVSWSQPFSNHSHTGAGNSAVTASSTVHELLQGDTTCKIKSDKTAIWFPSIVKAGVVQAPALLNYYYIGSTVPVRPPADGFRFVAGDHANTSVTRAAGLWSCVKAGNVPVTTPQRTLPASCPAEATHVSVSMYNGGCWDGRNFGPGLGGSGGPANGRDHVSTNAASQPETRVQVCDDPEHVQLPTFLFSVRWPVTAAGGRLSSDDPVAPAGTSWHMDVVVLWDFNSAGQIGLDELVDRCLNNPVPGLANGAISCQEITGADGVTRLFTVGPSPALVTD